MTRLNLDQVIQRSKDVMLILGSMVEQATMRSIEALKNHDFGSSKIILDYE